ncbi:MAG: hypothetical protein J2P52_01200 [Blastocatellia bacterium]|nr:hypothetical protein [Blastocatellia bacterium]
MSQFGYTNPRAIPQRGPVRPNAPPAVKTIPFDYVFQFTLLGQRGNKAQDVVEISSEGIFVALSVGYSLVPDEQKTPRVFGPVIEEGGGVILLNDAGLVSTTSRPLAEITLGEIVAGLAKAGANLTAGFRVSPDSAGLLTSDLPLDQLSPGAIDRVFEIGAEAAEDVSFLYSLDISSSGREYQNKPIHNIAGLGTADGDRPFRPFAKPFMFEPKASVRIQVEELSGPAGTLYIVLQGYKMLGAGRITG